RKPLALLRRNDERLNRATHFVRGVTDREASLGHDRPNEVVPMRFDELRRPHQYLVAIVGGERVRLERVPSGGDGGRHLSFRRTIGFTDLRAGELVVHGVRGRTSGPLPTNQQLSA